MSQLAPVYSKFIPNFEFSIFTNFYYHIRAAVFVREVDILTVVPTLKKISQKRIADMRKNCVWLWDQYFKSMEKITQISLDIIEDRVFPHLARDYGYWNLRPRAVSFKIFTSSRIFEFVEFVRRLFFCRVKVHSFLHR